MKQVKMNTTKSYFEMAGVILVLGMVLGTGLYLLKLINTVGSL